MAGLPAGDDWVEEIYRIEEADPVLGGVPNEATGAGLVNIPHWQIARRTSWLKVRVDQLVNTVVAASLTVAGVVRLSSATNSSSETTAATPAAVKAANDNAETRALKATSINAAGLATGGGNLSADRTITVMAATPAEAAARAINNRAMTPMTTGQAITAALTKLRPNDLGVTSLARNLSGIALNTGDMVAGTSIRSASVSGANGMYMTGTFVALSVAGVGDIGLFLKVSA